MDQRRPRGEERNRERRRSRTRSPPPLRREAAALPSEGAAVACTRANLQPLFTSFKDMMKLVEVERFLLGEHSTSTAQQHLVAATSTPSCCWRRLPACRPLSCAPFPPCSPPRPAAHHRRRGRAEDPPLTVVRGLLVRYNYDGYRLGLVARYLVEDGEDKVAVQVCAVVPACSLCNAWVENVYVVAVMCQKLLCSCVNTTLPPDQPSASRRCCCRRRRRCRAARGRPPAASCSSASARKTRWQTQDGSSTGSTSWRICQLTCSATPGDCRWARWVLRLWKQGIAGALLHCLFGHVVVAGFSAGLAVSSPITSACRWLARHGGGRRRCAGMRGTEASQTWLPTCIA